MTRHPLPYLVIALLVLVGSSIAAPSSGRGLPPTVIAQSGAPRGQATAGYVPGVTPGPAKAEYPSGAPPTNPVLTATDLVAGGIGTALIGGWATYWDTCADCAAAGPLLRAMLGPDWQGQTITVVSEHGEATLRLVTSCACGPRQDRPTIIDVSVEAFNVLSPQPARSDFDPGYIAVSIEVAGPRLTAPPTDGGQP